MVAPSITGRARHSRVGAAPVLARCTRTARHAVCRRPRCTPSTCRRGHCAVLAQCTRVTPRRGHCCQHVRHRARWTLSARYSCVATVPPRRTRRAAHCASLTQCIGRRARQTYQAARLPSAGLILPSGTRHAGSTRVDPMPRHAEWTRGALAQSRCTRGAARSACAVLILPSAASRTRHCRAGAHLAHRTSSARGGPRTNQSVRHRA